MCEEQQQETYLKITLSGTRLFITFKCGPMHVRIKRLISELSDIVVETRSVLRMFLAGGTKLMITSSNAQLIAHVLSMPVYACNVVKS